MAINPYFNFYSATNEQTLVENLIIESIKMYGFNSYYVKRTLRDYDEVFREATVSSYDSATLVEVYLKSMMKFEGDGKFISRTMGLEIRDEMTITIARKVFEDNLTDLDRPREGDILYFPLDKKLYEIKYVDHQSVFYQLGNLNVYDLECELFEYSGEIFNTGIADIDAINNQVDLNGVEENTIEDYIDQSSEFQSEGNNILDFDPDNPFGLGTI